MDELYPGYREEIKKRDDLAARIERGHAAVLPGALREAFAGEPAIVEIARSVSSPGGDLSNLGSCERNLFCASGTKVAQQPSERVRASQQTGEGGKTSGVAADCYRLQPVTLGLAANLERIKSPLLEIVRIMREVFSERGTVPNAFGTVSDRGGASVLASRSPADVSVSVGPVPSPGAENKSTEPTADLSKIIHTRLASLKFDDESIAETVFIFTRPQKRVRKLLDAGRDKFREAVMDELGDRLHPAQMAALQRACAQHYVQSFATIIGYGAPAPEDGAVVFPPPSPGAATGSVGG